MRQLHILLECLRVSEGCLDPTVAQEPLHLLQRHPALEGQGSSRVPEDVRRDVDADGAPGKDLLDLILHGLHLQPVVWHTAADEQGRVFILPGGQVSPQGDLRLRVEERGTAFSALAAFDVYGVICEIDVRDVESAEFRYTAGGGIQEVNHRFFTECLTYTADRFQLQGRHREPLRAVHPDGRNTADRILLNEVFLDAPLEEGIKTDPHALQCGVFHIAVLLILEEVYADVVGRDLVDWFVNNAEELSQPEQVQAERAL